jgi:hypothetical protein
MIRTLEQFRRCQMVDFMRDYTMTITSSRKSADTIKENSQ